MGIFDRLIAHLDEKLGAPIQPGRYLAPTAQERAVDALFERIRMAQAQEGAVAPDYATLIAQQLARQPLALNAGPGPGVAGPPIPMGPAGGYPRSPYEQPSMFFSRKMGPQSSRIAGENLGEGTISEEALRDILTNRAELARNQVIPPEMAAVHHAASAPIEEALAAQAAAGGGGGGAIPPFFAGPGFDEQAAGAGGGLPGFGEDYVNFGPEAAAAAAAGGGGRFGLGQMALKGDAERGIASLFERGKGAGKAALLPLAAEAYLGGATKQHHPGLSRFFSGAIPGTLAAAAAQALFPEMAPTTLWASRLGLPLATGGLNALVGGGHAHPGATAPGTTGGAAGMSHDDILAMQGLAAALMAPYASELRSSAQYRSNILHDEGLQSLSDFENAQAGTNAASAMLAAQYAPYVQTLSEYGPYLKAQAATQNNPFSIPTPVPVSNPNG